MPNDAPPIPPLLLNTRDAAATLSISERNLWSNTAPRGRRIPCVRLNGRVLYSVAALQRWIAEQEGAGE